MNRCAIAALLVFASAQLDAADFMGLNFGEEFNMPECERIESSHSVIYKADFQQSTRPCWILGNDRRNPAESRTFRVGFIAAKNDSPRGVTDAEVIVMDGRIQGVLAFTTGIRDQDSIYALLLEKFGNPNKSTNGTAQNRFGAELNQRMATWELPRFTVSFLGIGVSMNRGAISALTPTGRAYEDEDKKLNNEEHGRF